MNLRDRAKVAKKVILIEAAIVLFVWVVAIPWGNDIALSIALVIHILVALSYIFYLGPVCLAAAVMGYD